MDLYCNYILYNFSHVAKTPDNSSATYFAVLNQKGHLHVLY